MFIAKLSHLCLCSIFCSPLWLFCYCSCCCCCFHCCFCCCRSIFPDLYVIYIYLELFCCYNLYTHGSLIIHPPLLNETFVLLRLFCSHPICRLQYVSRIATSDCFLSVTFPCMFLWSTVCFSIPLWSGCPHPIRPRHPSPPHPIRLLTTPPPLTSPAHSGVAACISTLTQHDRYRSGIDLEHADGCYCTCLPSPLGAISVQCIPGIDTYLSHLCL